MRTDSRRYLTIASSSTREDFKQAMENAQQETLATVRDAKLAQKALTTISEQPFRLLELPAEMRNRIYSHALCTNGEPLELAQLRSPALIAVNKQVRQESMPIFFAETTFIVSTTTNAGDYGKLEVIKARARPLKGWKTYDERAVFARKCGITGLSRPTRKWLKELGTEEATFRHLHFHVSLEGYVTHRVLLLLHMTTPVAGSLISKVVGPQHTFPTPDQKAGLAVVIEAAEGVIQDCKCRSGFRGFTVRDILAIAKAFRYWPVE